MDEFSGFIAFLVCGLLCGALYFAFQSIVNDFLSPKLERLFGRGQTESIIEEEPVPEPAPLPQYNEYKLATEQRAAEQQEKTLENVIHYTMEKLSGYMSEADMKSLCENIHTFQYANEQECDLPDFVLTQNSNTIARAYPDDIIIAKGGNTLAKVGILTNEYPEYAICRDVILLRTRKLSNNMRYAVWAFLHSKFGYNLMLRTASQTGQPHLTLPNILKMMIPVWGEDMISKLCKLYNQSNLHKDQSKTLYDEAEDILLSELGLNDCKSTE